ncbi:MAG: DsbA family protein [Epsilonproteobacteria bacterium]|nr:DsbA family protein [Campylobacterota bacterium]
MSRFIKIFFIVLSLQLILSAKALSQQEVDKKITEAVKHAIRVGKNFKLKDVKIKAKKKLKQPKGWSAYFLDIFLEVKKDHNKTELIQAVDTVFSDGTYLAKDLLNLKTGRSIKREVALDLTPKYYRKDHLIAGNFNAKNKLVVFSDPQCPFCQDFVPELIKFVQEHPKDFALFYYHFPLDVIHPASPTLIRVMLAAQKKLKMDEGDFLIKVYEHYFDIPTTNEDKIIETFNKAFKTNITKADIHTPDIEKRVKEDYKMAENLAISGTPAFYINGKKDPTRSKHLKMVKDNKSKK